MLSDNVMSKWQIIRGTVTDDGDGSSTAVGGSFGALWPWPAVCIHSNNRYLVKVTQSSAWEINLSYLWLMCPAVAL